MLTRNKTTMKRNAKTGQFENEVIEKFGFEMLWNMHDSQVKSKINELIDAFNQHEKEHVEIKQFLAMKDAELLGLSERFDRVEKEHKKEDEKMDKLFMEIQEKFEDIEQSQNTVNNRLCDLEHDPSVITTTGWKVEFPKNLGHDLNNPFPLKKTPQGSTGCKQINNSCKQSCKENWDKLPYTSEHMWQGGIHGQDWENYIEEYIYGDNEYFHEGHLRGSCYFCKED